MRSGPVAALACAVIGVMLASVPASAAGMYYAKRGITPARFEADQADCIAKAKKVYDEKKANMNVPYQPGLAGAAVTGFFGGVERGRMKREAIAQVYKCIEAKGYRKVPLTKEQEAVLQQLDREQRKKAAGILASGGNIASLLSNSR
jgi:hypothetical protein